MRHLSILTICSLLQFAKVNADEINERGAGLADAVLISRAIGKSNESILQRRGRSPRSPQGRAGSQRQNTLGVAGTGVQRRKGGGDPATHSSAAPSSIENDQGRGIIKQRGSLARPRESVSAIEQQTGQSPPDDRAAQSPMKQSLSTPANVAAEFEIPRPQSSQGSRQGIAAPAQAPPYPSLPYFRNTERVKQYTDSLQQHVSSLPRSSRGHVLGGAAYAHSGYPRRRPRPVGLSGALDDRKDIAQGVVQIESGSATMLTAHGSKILRSDVNTKHTPVSGAHENNVTGADVWDGSFARAGLKISRTKAGSGSVTVRGKAMIHSRIKADDGGDVRFLQKSGGDVWTRQNFPSGTPVDTVITTENPLRYGGTSAGGYLSHSIHLKGPGEVLGTALERPAREDLIGQHHPTWR